MWRHVIGKIFRTDDTPWINATVIFTRTNDSYTTDIQYPSDTIIANTDSQGNLIMVKNNIVETGVRLWVNETGDKISIYNCQINNANFDFTIPVGDGNPIKLSVLRQGNLPIDEYPQTIIDYVDSKFSAVSLNKYEIFNATPINNTYNLSSVPTIPNKSKVYINGLKQQFGIDFNINNSLINVFKPLPINYLLEVYYG